MGAYPGEDLDDVPLSTVICHSMNIDCYVGLDTENVCIPKAFTCTSNLMEKVYEL